MRTEFAHKFSEAWIAAWNAHDLEKILSHYDEDFEMSSPVIRKIVGEPTGKLRGKKAIRAYWTKALALNPDLSFELQNVLIGANSITILYYGVRGLAAEVFHFNAEGKVIQAFAHYAAHN